ncbi:response regulator [Roseospirillum parvum]|uniref:Response regulator receiver domain-containing protein n=1 Tax=Roseospirillum parvum TaxID=83401 RepID=A0A1G7WKN3_9PROT|nr:response regulator [Roseospirillum parvum]SDG72565.1 Response regulator receiver domain-containing protein [Roseospirillum parvum]
MQASAQFMPPAPTGRSLMRRPDFDPTLLRVLVAEDNPHFRRLIRTVLTGLAIDQVTEAGNGAEALKLVQTRHFDLGIVDFRMEPVDGIAFTRQVRTDPDSANPYLPIIMVTAHGDPKLIATARNAGVSEFLVKPISAKSLLARLVAVVEHPRAFIRTASYFGPDRRRRQQPFDGSEKRQAPTTPD